MSKRFNAIKAKQLKKTEELSQKASRIATLGQGGSKEANTTTSSSTIRSLSTVYDLPAGTTDEQKKSFVMYLIAVGRARTVTMQSVKNWLYTISYALYQREVKSGENIEYVRVVLESAVVAKIHKAINQNVTVMDLDKESKDEIRQKQIDLANTFEFRDWTPQLPVPAVVSPNLLYFPFYSTLVYGYYGIICFSLIKDVTNQGQPALMDARPDAILRKYHSKASEYPYLGGETAPVSEFYEMLHNAWRQLPFLRRGIFTYMSMLQRSRTTAEDEAAYTTTSMMRWGENAHVAIILRFATIDPLAKEWEPITPEWQSFNSEVEAMLELCPPVVNSSGQAILGPDKRPLKDESHLSWLKLVMLDKMSLAKRNSHEKLLEIAHHVVSEIDPKLQFYTATSNHPDAVAGYIAFRDEYNKWNAADDLESDDESTETED